MTAFLIGGIGSAMAFLCLRKKFIQYQLALLVVFLVGLTISGELDATLPILIVFSLAPALRGIGRFSRTAILFIVVSLAYLVYGVLFQNAAASLVTFLSRLMQFIAFYLVLDNSVAKVKLEPGIALIVAMTLFESVIGLYLIKNGSMAANIEMEGIRLVSNSQPITGNIAIAIMPLIGYVYYIKKPYGKQLGVLFACSLILAFWVVLSGTRGYTLVFGAGLALILFDYFFTGDKTRFRVEFATLIFCLLAIACLAAAVTMQDQLFAGIDNSLRLSDSLGIRDQENQVARLFYLNISPVNQVFGIGIGESWSNYSEYVSAVRQVFGATGVEIRYLGRAGTNFHNFYANIICLQGLVGAGLIVLVFGNILAKVNSYCHGYRKMRRFLVVYVLMIALMLYFRWSADCGITEFIMLACILNLIKAQEEHAATLNSETLLCRNATASNTRRRKTSK